MRKPLAMVVFAYMIRYIWWLPLGLANVAELRSDVGIAC